MSRQSHIIQQQKIEVQFENFSDGIGIQNEMAELFYEQLYPKLEILFDELTSENYSITIDKLEIDCGQLSTRHWKQELVDETLYRLRQQLIMLPKKEIKQQGATAKESIHDDLFDHLLFFLKKGYLHWNSRIHSTSELEEIFLKEPIIEKSFVEKLKELFKENPLTAERFSYHFYEKIVKKIIEQLAKNRSIEIEKIFINEQKSTPYQKKIFHSQLLKILSSENSIAEEIYSFTGNYDKKEKPKEIKKQTVEKIKDEEEGDAIYIQNAGLVILHPFLPELFTRLELLVDKQWKDVYSQHTAAIVLEYLATGKEDFFEFNFPLNKTLCGIPVNEVLQPVEELSLSIKNECEDLLKDIIRHWSILKNTSVDGLRETFLQRNGKLTQVENGWLLNVEQKGVDILLNSLPWGIGTIKLPWADKKLHVEWIA
jgi:hypothetical protein